MNRRLRIWLVVSIVLAGLWATRKLPEHLRRVEFFQARQYEVEGNHYLTKEMVLELSSFPAGTSIFDDLGGVELRLKDHEMILNARVQSNWWPTKIVVTIEERVPLALVAEPLLVPVDREGNILPIDLGKYRLDLPLVRVKGNSEAQTEEEWDEDQVKAMVLELERLGLDNPFFTEALSEVAIDQDGNAEAILDRDVVLRFRPPLMNQVLNAGLAALEDVKRRRSTDAGIVIDLRFEDQVVVSYGEGGGW
jgi:hypothetical protein